MDDKALLSCGRAPGITCDFYEPIEHEVGFEVRNSLLKMVKPTTNGSAAILTLFLSTTEGPARQKQMACLNPGCLL